MAQPKIPLPKMKTLKLVLQYLAVAALLALAIFIWSFRLSEQTKSFGGYEMPDVSVKHRVK